MGGRTGRSSNLSSRSSFMSPTFNRRMIKGHEDEDDEMKGFLDRLDMSFEPENAEFLKKSLNDSSLLVKHC